jgi:hypothetical protein
LATEHATSEPLGVPMNELWRLEVTVRTRGISAWWPKRANA